MHGHAGSNGMCAALVVALAASLVAGCSLPARRSPLSVIEPSIVPSTNERGSRTLERGFDFEGGRVTLSVPMDRAVLAGSASAAKSVVFVGGAAPADWVPDYYRAFIGERHQAAFYDAILASLHEVRRRDGLDPSRYVELVTSMAQGLEYRTDPVNLAPKFPIETFGDGYGDCDDKTLLAAALLSRDGYDVAVLLFTPEKHVALGVRAPGLDYKGTGYAYVEMTEPSLVGVPAERFAGGVRLTSAPVVIAIGQGTRTFAAGPQVAYIERRRKELQAAETRMRAEIAGLEANLTATQASLAADRPTLQTITDPQAQAAAIRRYNQRVQAANDLAARVNGLVAKYNALVAVERYVAKHQFARPQVYERLRSARFQ